MRIALVVFLLAGCGKGEEEIELRFDQPPATCTAPGLEHAHSVPALQIPRECSATGGSFDAPRAVRSQDELASALSCSEGTTLPNFDMRRRDVYVLRFSMSPAYGGSEIFDDGHIVTFLTRDRPPCPGDPRPMPMESSMAFSLPHGAARTFRHLACTLPRRCP